MQCGGARRVPVSRNSSGFDPKRGMLACTGSRSDNAFTLLFENCCGTASVNNDQMILVWIQRASRGAQFELFNAYLIDEDASHVSADETE